MDRFGHRYKAHERGKPPFPSQCAACKRQTVIRPAPAVECRSTLARTRQHAGVVKLVNTADLKFAAEMLTGSIPVLGTSNQINGLKRLSES